MAEAKKAAAPVVEAAPKKEPEPVVPKVEPRKPIYIPRGMGDRVVGINGKNYILPEGQTSMVPAEVAREIKRAERAKDAFAATVDNLTNLPHM